VDVWCLTMKGLAMNTRINFSKGQKVTITALVGMGLFNPMSVEILDQYFKMIYTGLFLVSAAWVVFYLLKKVLTPEPVNVKPKGKKKKTDYIENI
jgi:hypothetical protein